MQIHLPVLPLLVLSKVLPARDHRLHGTKDETEPQPLRTCSRSSGCWLVTKGFELRKSDSISIPSAVPQQLWGPTNLGRSQRTSPHSHSCGAGRSDGNPGLEVRCVCVCVWGGGGFPTEAIASACPPCSRSQAQEAQGRWPDSWTGGGELSGETHRREKLLGNSGWPPTSVTRRLSQLRAPELGTPSPRFLQLGLSWKGSEDRQGRRGSALRPSSSGVSSRSPPRPLLCPA